MTKGFLAMGATILSRDNSRLPRGIMLSIALLVFIGIASLLIAEQVFSGWLALGERANISRSDLNATEWAVIVGSAAWGLMMLWVAWGIFRDKTPAVRKYFEQADTSISPGAWLIIILLTVTGIVSLIIAEQVFTGWMALGDRINISRRELNLAELLVIVVGLIWGFVTLRTAWGFYRREKASWSWAQWLLLFTMIVGLVVLLSGTFDLHTILPEDGNSILSNLPGALELTAAGVLIFLSAMAGYLLVTVDVDTAAAQSLRNTLAQVPGAGAIIGFIAIFILFSIASDLFLEPRALAGALSTNVTRGIIAIGITMLMISGEFDLSVGSIYGASALMFLLAMTEGVLGLPPMSAIPAAIVGLIFAGVLGLINGLVMIWTNIPSFIVTLGTMLAYRALPLVIIAEGRILRYADYRLPPPDMYVNRWLAIVIIIAVAIAVGFIGRSLLPGILSGFRERLANRKTDDNDFSDLFLVLSLLRFVVTLVAVVGAIVLLLWSVVNLLGRSETLLAVNFFDLMNGRFEFLPRDVNLRSGVLWWFLLVIAFQFVLNQTPYGSYTFAAGGNPGAARAQGVNVTRIKVTNFVLCAVMAGVAGITNVARVTSVNANLGDGLELEVIAASVIGGALLTGGYGSIFGALLGVFIFGMLQTGLVLIGMNPRVFHGVIGTIIILAVVINTAARRQTE